MLEKSTGIAKVLLPNDVLFEEVKAQLAAGKTVVLKPRGFSMNPFIVGDVDDVVLAVPESVGAGDIALAEYAPGKYLLHRVIKVDGDTVLMKGDGNLDNVERCSRAMIRAVVLEIVHPGGRRVDCRSQAFLKRSLRWRTLPRPVRRVLLVAFRRLKIRNKKRI